MDPFLAKLKAGIDNRKPTKWPGTDTDIEIRVITDNDLAQAGLMADRIYNDSKIPVAAHNIDAYDAEKETQILYRVVLQPGTDKPVAPTITDFRKVLTKDVREQLMSEATELQEECSPNPELLNEQEFDILLERIKKNAASILGNVSNIALLRKLVLTLVSLQEK